MRRPLGGIFNSANIYTHLKYHNYLIYNDLYVKISRINKIYHNLINFVISIKIFNNWNNLVNENSKTERKLNLPITAVWRYSRFCAKFNKQFFV